MAEYIEREAVIDTLYAAFKKYWKIPCSNVDMAVQRDVVHTKNKIYEIPAADVVPVVRCENCVWGKKWINFFGNAGFRRNLFCADVRESDFCSYGAVEDVPETNVGKMEGERKGDDA